MLNVNAFAPKLTNHFMLATTTLRCTLECRGADRVAVHCKGRKAV
jgi:hypothetical protein